MSNEYSLQYWLNDWRNTGWQERLLAQGNTLPDVSDYAVAIAAWMYWSNKSTTPFTLRAIGFPLEREWADGLVELLDETIVEVASYPLGIGASGDRAVQVALEEGLWEDPDIAQEMLRIKLDSWVDTDWVKQYLFEIN